MIPRKIAKKLLDEYLAEVERLEVEQDEALDEAGLRDAIHAVLERSVLVVRGAENAEQKARRYLTEGRIVVEQLGNGGPIVARARGSEGVDYHLGYDPKRKEWRCTCPAKGSRCSHLIALRMIVDAPAHPS